MSYQSLSDEELVGKIQSGCEDAFAVLIERYEKKLERYVKYVLSAQNVDYDDIVQEAFIKAYTNIQGYSTRQKFSSWIYRIAHNQAIDTIRKYGKYTSDSLHELEYLIPGNEDVVSDINQEDIRQQVESALVHLPLKYRTVLVLYYFEEKSYNDIVDILHIPLKTVGTLMHRAKKALRVICEQRGVRP